MPAVCKKSNEDPDSNSIDKRDHDPESSCHCKESIIECLHALKAVDYRLRVIETVLKYERDRDNEIYRLPDDEDNFIGITQTCLPSVTTTLTWSLHADYIYYFRKIYVDKKANATYQWTFQATTEKEKTKTLDGNEHDFGFEPVRAKGKTTLTLALTNSGTSSINVDIAINSWARRAK